MKTRGSRGTVPHFLISALDGVVELHVPAALPLGERAPGTHLMGPRVGLDDAEKRKNLALPRIEPKPSIK
jgi:hypothetical protein